MYQPGYDPHAHADEMNVRVVYHSLRDNYGIWVPERRMIIVDRGCPAHLVTPVLSHECDHALNNDPAGHHPRNEARANLNSARRLANLAEFDGLIAIYADYDRICLELGLTREQFTALAEWRRAQQHAEKKQKKLDVFTCGLVRSARELMIA